MKEIFVTINELIIITLDWYKIYSICIDWHMGFCDLIDILVINCQIPIIN